MGQEHPPHVLVVGGGPAGLAAAIELARNACSVIVVERSAYEDVRIGEHLPPSVALRFSGFASNLDLALDRHSSSSGVDAYWGSDTPNHMDYFFLPGQRGINLVRPGFDAELARACESLGVKVLRSSSVAHAEMEEWGWRVEIYVKGSPSTITAALILDASGRGAAFARRQGARIYSDDQQIALAAFGSGSKEPENTRSLVEATEAGWWYYAPLSPSRSICMYMTDRDLVPSAGRLHLRNWWYQNLIRTKQIAQRFQNCEDPRQLYVRSARSQYLDPQHGNSWMAIGDAAMALDPLSSRGIEKALSHGERAASAISQHLVGSRSALENFSNELRREYIDYIQTRRSYYLLEMRWPDSIFWKRRHTDRINI